MMTNEIESCPDCGCKTGEYHLKSCDIERCPKCKMQLLSCDCPFTMIAEDDSALFIKEGGRRYNRFKWDGNW